MRNVGLSIAAIILDLWLHALDGLASWYEYPTPWSVQALETFRLTRIPAARSKTPRPPIANL